MNDLSAAVSLLLQDAFWSGLAAMGFAILFNVPRRALPYCMMAGALGHAVRTGFMVQFGFSIVSATLIGATVVGAVASLSAARLRMPSLIFGISGAIPMVPGVFAFQTMIGLLELIAVQPDAAGEIVTRVALNAVQTGFILAALAAGIVAPSLIFQRTRPVV